MKTYLIQIACILSLVLNLNAQENLQIDVTKSELKWSGEYTFYFGGHDGFIKFQEGYFIKTGNQITGGYFIIDMNSITNSDIKEEDANEGLVSHLKNPDFFDVEQFSKATLKITNVEYHNATDMKVYADLTIKNITNPVSFQAQVNFEKQQLITKFKIDRVLWGINYNSKLKDGAISDAIGFEVLLSL
ncbi:MAG: YceI family protein [Psychroserpens sp.]|uniref:YceI family protein n=1 Tax=Psychroserpens sp. TaxID=2020870 RepID=UPI003C718606